MWSLCSQTATEVLLYHLPPCCSQMFSSKPQKNILSENVFLSLSAGINKKCISFNFICHQSPNASVPHPHTAYHPLQRYVTPSTPAHLFDVRVEGDRHVQQDFALLHTTNKVLDSVFELVGSLVDLLWVALSRLGQLLGRLQELVGIGVRVLRQRRETREDMFTSEGQQKARKTSTMKKEAEAK